ncbi:MAG: T9SS type A sorting domain-containing protein [Marinilabiliales bacterium]
MKIILIYCFILIFNILTFAQVVDSDYYNYVKTKLTTTKLLSPDIDKLLKEDSLQNGYIYYRNGVAVHTDLDIEKGTWFNYKEKKICLIKIYIENAKALGLDFNALNLPEDAQMYIYNESRKNIIGPITNKDVLYNGCFASDLIKDNNIIVEYSLPAGIQDFGYFNISDIVYVYKDISLKSYGDAGQCEVNINCPEGNKWQDEKHGVAKIYLKVGSDYGFCTGTLINNTSGNCENYFLTADHCGNGASDIDLNFWRFYFDYESDDCDNPTIEPASYMTFGCEYVASSGEEGHSGSDFYLVKIINPNFPNPLWNVYYNGWNISDIATSSGACIHHPHGDIKKISVFNIQPISSSVGSIPDTHWRIIWSGTQSGHGITEPGSSGSPLFDKNGYIIGTLTGGLSDCENPYNPDYFGKISYSWDKNANDELKQLKPWLDPLNRGVEKLDGKYYNECINSIKVVDNYEINIYPNPASSYINIDFSSCPYIIINEICITDNIGQVILLKKNLSVFKDMINIETQNFNNGIYFLSIVTDNFNFVKKFTVIK